MKLQSYYLLIILFFLGCSDESNETPPRNNGGQSGNQISPALEEMIDLASEYFYLKYDRDWDKIQEDTRDKFRSSGFQSAVIFLLDQLNDNHSYYITDEGVWYWQSDVPFYTPIDYEIEDMEGVGYVKVFGFFGPGNDGASISFASTIQQTIRTQDEDSLSFWIVDLSENTGGNMYPMIAGLGPFYQQSIFGYFIDADGIETSYGYANGSSFYRAESNIITTVSNPYELKNPEAKVAVILGRRNGSSGEATAISFKGRPNTRFFGEPTYGVSTSIQQFPIVNGGTFGLATGLMADRDKVPYPDGVSPDVFNENSQSLNEAINQWFTEE